MISNETHHQLGTLIVDPTRPLLICDVDEVIVHFTTDFEDFLGVQDMWLEPRSLSLAGNIFRRGSGEMVPQDHINTLIDTFFAERTRNMKPILGAIESVKNIGNDATVVFLTNLPHFAGDDRRANLADLGLDYPVITNSGPKGPALHNLAARTKAPVVFVDDSPFFIKSANEHAPHIKLVHFLQDQRFAAHTPHFDFVSLRTDNWASAKSHILELMS
jgi:hypothetical protein